MGASALPLLLQSRRKHPKPPGQRCQSAPSGPACPHSPPWMRCCQWGLQEERKFRIFSYFPLPHISVLTEMPPVQLTSLVVPDTKVCRGQVDIHIVLEDLLEETLSLSQLERLRCIHIWEPLASLGLRWQIQQKDRTLDIWSRSAKYHVRLISNQTEHMEFSQTHLFLRCL